jgi:hypothetical protein
MLYNIKFNFIHTIIIQKFSEILKLAAFRPEPQNTVLNKAANSYILLPEEPKIPVSKRSGLMKKTIFPIFLLFAIIALTSISCKTTPPAETAPTPSTTGAIRDALNRAGVEEARKRAQDFESPSYFPSDWEAVEAEYAEAGNMPKSNNSEIQQATAALNRITGTYNDLFKKTIPLYAQAREDEIMAARDELIHTGFTNVFPEYLKNADNMTLAALSQYEAEDYYAARDTAAAALDEYKTLQTGARVFIARQEIVDRGFIEYDPDNFARADEVTQAAMEKYEAGDKKAAVDSAEEALLRYNLVLKNGWTTYAADRRSSASAERERAISNKVNVAVREGFREADALFNHAEEIFKTEKFEDAAILFTESEALFVVAGQETDEKRRRAMETIRIAEEMIEASDETASEAERIIEGGSR